MTTEKVEIVATAKDQASATLKKLQSNVTSLGSKGRGPLGGLLTGLGGISPVALVGAAGIGVLTGALADGVAGALEEDKQMARLGATLKANVKNWDGSTEAVDRATSAAMDLAFSDDDARESMIKLITATGSVETATKDMHLAMEIARGRNIDLATATDIVAKANMGNVGALRRMGIEIDKDATKTEILTTLQQRYAGQAEAYAATIPGAFEASQKKVDDSLEGIGHALIQAGATALDVGKYFSPDYWITYWGDQYKAATTTNLQVMADHLKSEAADRLPPVFKDAGKESGRVFAKSFNDSSAAYANSQAFADKFNSTLSDDLVGTLRHGGIKDIMKDLNWAINHPEKLEKFGQKIQEALNNPKLKAALGSDNPFLQLVASQTQDKLTGLWNNITGGASDSTDAVEALTQALRILHGAFQNLPLDPHLPNFDRTLPSNYGGPRAGGGPVNAGETYLVGEKGPELLHMGRGNGYVQANGGGHAHQIVVNVDGRKLFEIMNERMGREMSLASSGVVLRG